jgi:hypothetical protein
MLPHQQRVLDEKVELDERLKKLSAFVVTDAFNRLDSTDRELLLEQEDAMTTYSDVLGRRIANF